MAIGAVSQRHVIISLDSVPDFDKMPLKAADEIVYNQLIPACKAQGIKLSPYGNHAGQGSIADVRRYNRRQALHSLFDVQKIQQVFALLKNSVQSATPFTQPEIGSYGLKRIIEKQLSQKLSQDPWINHGELILAMLLLGHKAYFGSPACVDCKFEVTVI